MAQESKLCTAVMVADMLGVSADTIRRWARDGKLDVVRLPSGQPRFRRSDVEALIARPPDVAESSDGAAEVSPRASAASPTSKSA